MRGGKRKGGGRTEGHAEDGVVGVAGGRDRLELRVTSVSERRRRPDRKARTYRPKAHAVPVVVRRVQVEVRVERVDWETNAAELKGDVNLLVARDLPDFAGEVAAGDELCVGHVTVERFRYVTSGDSEVSVVY